MADQGTFIVGWERRDEDSKVPSEEEQAALLALLNEKSEDNDLSAETQDIRNGPATRSQRADLLTGLPANIGMSSMGARIKHGRELKP